ncbi:hypothetical protein Tco_1492006 [Tanacetum coccineum]
MAQLEFCDKHNMVAYLVKSASSEGFDEIIDFLTSSNIYYALTENPIIFVSLIEQFWETAILSTTEEGLQVFTTTIDGHEKIITEDSLRRHLKSFLTLMEVLYSYNSALSKLQEDCIGSIQFIQLLLNKQQRLLLPHTRTYPTPILTSKLFSNMRIASKGYSGVVTPLFENMLVQAHDEEQQQSPSRITSSPSLSLQPTQPSSLPKPIQPTHETKKTYSTVLTKLVLRVKKKESKLKSGKAKRKAKIILSDDEEIAEDSSKQGRKISQINEDPTISLVQDEGKMEISTANIQVSTASPPKLSIDKELDRKLEEEERIMFNAEQEARALQEEEEERLNLEAARELQRQLDQRQHVLIQPTQTQGIDWNDPRGDLKILVDPEQDDDIWKNQNQWKIISWKLYETYGVHTLMVDGTLMTIHMFVEKKYPLTKETLKKMLNWKLEAKAESSMAFELLKFIKTQIEEL